MPVPINFQNSKNNNENNSFLDISFLNSLVQDTETDKKASSSFVVLSNKDADDLMKIWLEAEKVNKETFRVGNQLGLNNNDLIRLKARGLLRGDTQEVTFTPKAKTVICTMTLGENNKFLDKKKEKSYTEILASMDKRGKSGYRTAHIFSEHSHLLILDDDNTFDKELYNKLMEVIDQGNHGF